MNKGQIYPFLSSSPMSMTLPMFLCTFHSTYFQISGLMYIVIRDRALVLKPFSVWWKYRETAPQVRIKCKSTRNCVKFLGVRVKLNIPPHELKPQTSRKTNCNSMSASCYRVTHDAFAFYNYNTGY